MLTLEQQAAFCGGGPEGFLPIPGGREQITRMIDMVLETAVNGRADLLVTFNHEDS